MSIKSFKHKGLKKLFETGNHSGVQAHHVKKLTCLLDRLDAAICPEDMSFPGSDFHPLTGKRKSYYSVHVNGNWVLSFRFEGHNAMDVNYEDYH